MDNLLYTVGFCIDNDRPVMGDLIYKKVFGNFLETYIKDICSGETYQVWPNWMWNVYYHK